MSNSTIGDRLLEETRHLKGGATTVARMLGVARNTVRNWIHKGNIPANQLDALRNIGIDADYVFTGRRTSNTRPSSLLEFRIQRLELILGIDDEEIGDE